MNRRELAAAVALDLTFGDPRWAPHPVEGIGRLIAASEQALRATGMPLRLAGTLLAIAVPTVTASLVRATLPRANVYWVYAFLALRSLDNQSKAVIDALETGNLEQARGKLAMIVGRDTANLNEPEILRAAIETVSENLSDGIVAPLFYLAWFGPAGMAAYKAVNTLDSMVGHNNERYREFGWASARLDDVLNFIPARCTAFLVWVAAGLTRLDPLRSARITLRDGGSQPSPNSGWPEAAFAGALGVQLGGANYYQGVPSFKPTLGDPLQPLSPKSFRQSRRLLYASAMLMVAGVLVWW